MTRTTIERNAAASLAGLALAALTFTAFRMPLAAAIGAVLLVGLVIASWRPQATMLVYAASLVLFQVPLLSEARVALPTLAGALFIGAAALDLMTRPAGERPGSAVLKALVPMTGAIVLSAVVNWTRPTADPRMLLTFLALVASTAAVPRLLSDPRTAWRLTAVLSAGLALVCGLLIFEAFTGHYNQFGLFQANGNDDRAYGLADPNYTAALIVTLFPLVVARYVAGVGIGGAPMAMAAIGLASVGVVMTASRGGLLGLAVTAAAACAWVPVPALSGRTYPLLRRRAGMVLVLLCLLGVSVAAAPDVLWNRMQTLDRWSDSRHEARLRIWESYFEQFERSPLVGLGPGYVDRRDTVAHSTPLQMAVEAGAIGLIAFVVLTVAGIYEALRARRLFLSRGDAPMAALSGAIAASIIGFQTTALFLTSATHKELWLLFGIAAALHRMASPVGERAS